MISVPLAIVDHDACRQRAINSLSHLPPFPPVLARLTAEMAQESVSFQKIGELIESDTVLAASVLRVVNSPLYAMRSSVISVRHAVSVLGLARLRNIVLSFSVSTMWNKVQTPPGWSMAQFNRHGLAVAILADTLALETRVSYAEGAFTAGLLHDIGKLLIAISLPPGGDKAVDWENLYGLGHADLAATALARWNLPVPIAEAVRRQASPPVKGRLTLAAVLYTADHAAEAPAEEQSTFLGQIGLVDQAPRLLAEYERQFAALSAFF